MTTRTTSKMITFTHPFALDGVEGLVPAGSYAVDTEEETIDSVSFLAWRRTATRIQVTVAGVTQTHAVEPAYLESVLSRA